MKQPKFTPSEVRLAASSGVPFGPSAIDIVPDVEEEEEQELVSRVIPNSQQYQEGDVGSAELRRANGRQISINEQMLRDTVNPMRNPIRRRNTLINPQDAANNAVLKQTIINWYQNFIDQTIESVIFETAEDEEQSLNLLLYVEDRVQTLLARLGG